MKQFILQPDFIDTLTIKQYASLLATIRIYSVISMKAKVVVDTFKLRNLNNGEFVDLYSDLFATYYEGSKKYFQEYVQVILAILGVDYDDYTKKMCKIFLPENIKTNPTYKILNYIRNDFSFHFGIRKIDPIPNAPIGFINSLGHVTFVSTTPNLFRYIAEALDLEMTQESIQAFFRTVYNEEIHNFIEYLEKIIHQIVDGKIVLI